MQNQFLNFYQRIMMWTLVGGHQIGNLKEASTYLRLIEKLRLNDDEMLKSQFVQDGGKFQWQLPEPGYGSKTLELEADEAKAFITAIENAQGIRVTDAEWMLKLVDELKSNLPVTDAEVTGAAKAA